MMEIRFHGRGGQGAVTGVRVLATALYYDGKFTQGIPMYGTERRGAPVSSFLRVGEERIDERDLVHEPDMVVVLDPLLGQTVPVTDGLKKGGLVLINHPRGGRETGLGGEFKVATVDATRIAMETLGRPITNTAILGAFAKVTGSVTLESLEKAVLKQWPGRIGEVNITAVRKAYDEANMPVDVSDIEGIEVKPVGMMDRDVSSWRIFRPEIDAKKCIGCRRCYIFCPEVAITMAEDKAEINYKHCKGCGICVEECLVEAIEFIQEEI
ncbi:MAG: 2-oxoacid:acceptor oxidoreductase family protein [Candidatus Bathyarchaeota archaeon]|nr:MAG: 2-oxoacid:acceptor oxidoreductase family protein [Candidatus Bathyarchaeota archaeon]